MTTVFLAWRDPGRRWYPVGKLTRRGGMYRFVYIQGALEAHRDAGFEPLVSFPELHEVYQSPDLFPVFTNRMLSKRRPEFDDFVSWLALPTSEQDPLVLLARSNGRRATDAFEVFAKPSPDGDGRLRVLCFVHGIQHRGPEAIERVDRLGVGDPLRIEADPLNEVDRYALKALTDEETPVHIGFLPRYLNEDVNAIGAAHVQVSVEHINRKPTPLQFRLLVQLTGPWPEGFDPCSGPQYQSLAQDNDSVSTGS